ncbi:hypothetical protein GCM10011519_27200 [Marmoricola endophyticus]|uniref:Glycosyl transferase family 11 n=1 Tax=Marmoricola endophyticus TaxID=2040280 RepID=A0A917BNK7_9ACTN|nr:alpha-1,2-fucosyltransferase [Marmoricola endophyticus]GGF51741.1 hypothetical protein GCM10011519_27200 [Marmoricola endophyticus]
MTIVRDGDPWPDQERWAVQGISHLAVADMGGTGGSLAQRGSALVGTSTDAWATDGELLTALARRSRRAGADWVLVAGPDERGFARGESLSDALAATDADVVGVPVHDAVLDGDRWLLDRSRDRRGRVAFRTHTLARVGPDGSTVDRPGSRAGAPDLHLVRPARSPHGPVTEVDLKRWRTWDPDGALAGPDVVRSAQVPGTGAAPRTNRPTVIVAPPWMGFGNLLYLLLAAHTRRAAGRDCRVLRTPVLDRWATSLGTLDDLVADDVRRRDRREDPLLRTYGAFGLDFTADELADFVRARLLGSAALDVTTDPDPGLVTLNVRRGDYYSVPEHQVTYGFDQVAYLRAALAAAQEGAPVSRVRIVSDGPEWCRTRLGWLAEEHEVELAAPSDSALANFAEVAAARRPVITNSTFSYWAAYASNVRHGDNHADTVAPWFFSRAEAGGRAYQVDPRWRVVADIAGGWNGSTGESG